MAVFRKTKPTVQVRTADGSKPIAAASGRYGEGYNGKGLVGQYNHYFEGTARAKCISIPTISRARDLLASVAGSTPLIMYNEKWDETMQHSMQVQIAPRSWLKQPDPAISYTTFMSWLLDDLLFYGRAFLFISSRTQDGFPASFTRIPAGSVTTNDQAGPVFYAPSNEVYFEGGLIPPTDLVQFISPVQGIIYQSEKAVQTALRLESSRYRSAQSALPSGILMQKSGEPLSATELAELSTTFNLARENNQTAALSEGLEYKETTASPDKMLMIESATFQAMEMCRLANIPAYLAGLTIGGYSYTTSRSAREDLLLFGAQAYLNCIGQTLSMNNVLPRGTYVKFDVDAYLADMIGKDEYKMEPIDTLTNIR